jgi:hypothetical protein
VVSKSLNTTSKTEAERLEKQHDVEFDRRLCEAREAPNPEAVAIQIADNVRIDVNSANPYRYASEELAENIVLTGKQRETAEPLIGERLRQRLTMEGNINFLLSDEGIRRNEGCQLERPYSRHARLDAQALPLARVFTGVVGIGLAGGENPRPGPATRRR